MPLPRVLQKKKKKGTIYVIQRHSSQLLNQPQTSPLIPPPETIQMAESLPQYTAAATPQYDYVPNQGYITNPDRFADPEQAEEISQAVAPTQLQEEYDNDDDEEEDDDSYDELFDDELNDQDWTESGGGGGGDFTKSYNRQRKALEATNAASAEGVVKGNKLKPKANVKARVDDQIQSLTKFAARIKLGDMESGMGGASKFVSPTFLPSPLSPFPLTE